MEYGDFSMPARDRFEDLDVMAAEAAVYTVAGAESGATPCPNTYTVMPGDTYYRIANALGVTVYELSSMNPYVNPDALQIGQQLCVPAYALSSAQMEAEVAEEVGAQAPIGTFPAAERPETAPPPVLSAPTPAPEPAPAQRPTAIAPEGCTQLTVPSGWDCTNILMRYGISYRALESANPSCDMLALRGGQMLWIPPAGSRGHIASQSAPTHTIQRQETLESIARRYGTNVALLFRENPVMAPDDFVAGRIISIPQ